MICAQGLSDLGYGWSYLPFNFLAFLCHLLIEIIVYKIKRIIKKTTVRGQIEWPKSLFKCRHQKHRPPLVWLLTRNFPTGIIKGKKIKLN